MTVAVRHSGNWMRLLKKEKRVKENWWQWHYSEDTLDSSLKILNLPTLLHLFVIR